VPHHLFWLSDGKSHILLSLPFTFCCFHDIFRQLSRTICHWPTSAVLLQCWWVYCMKQPFPGIYCIFSSFWLRSSCHSIFRLVGYSKCVSLLSWFKFFGFYQCDIVKYTVMLASCDIVLPISCRKDMSQLPSTSWGHVEAVHYTMLFLVSLAHSYVDVVQPVLCNCHNLGYWLKRLTLESPEVRFSPLPHGVHCVSLCWWEWAPLNDPRNLLDNCL